MSLFFFNDTAPTEIYTLSLHDALPISDLGCPLRFWRRLTRSADIPVRSTFRTKVLHRLDRKSTRLNSSHANISYAVFCLKKKKNLISRRKTVMRPDAWSLDTSPCCVFR